VSSTDTRTEFFAAEVQAFEDVVLGQRPWSAEHYDDDYFASEWREGGNRYDLETRRRIEARSPELIKEVFEPRRVLDVGCGPGFLMQFLHELGVDVHGVDFSPASTTLAPEAVRDRIAIGDVTARHVEPQTFDLVICREVLEHLTVLQVRETVRQLCAASSRYVYATTRFHPDPSTLLDVTTQFDVDPTHITLMTKDLLRVLFVLEGFGRRSDLEDRMDWGGKGRVLVYERQIDGGAQ
jgi:SAM-dependent methyltransferase